jgi:spore maturation protein A
MRLLFKGMKHTSESARAITMNMAANLLGLGNAATPLGIAAMKAMAKEERCGLVATDNMVMFVVLNTASLQLIPTTTAIMRAAAGSLRPLDITPAVWLASAFSVAVGITAAKLMGSKKP